MNAIVALSLAAAIMVCATALAWSETFRDASGRMIGSATRDTTGTTTFRDASGQRTGSATTNTYGSTTYRDGSGRMIGTSQGKAR
jgi:hypothetical protein